ncbi:MAG: integron integrase, partial [Planctomycetes bacterium]|nr:integron integrase [Planctomycetota bacterium]
MSSPRPESRGGLAARVRDAIRIRHLSSRTEEAYLHWIRRYWQFCDRKDPAAFGPRQVTAFLNHLAVDQRVAAATQNQALAAVLFLYRHVLGQDLPWLDAIVRASRPKRLPTVLSRDEVRHLLEHMHGTPRLMATLLYGAGLRLLECCHLRVKDVDFGRRQLTIRSGKGGKDRPAILPASAAPALREQIDFVRLQHRRDLNAGSGYVELPSALDRKYPGAPRELAWQWVFPATRHYIHPETGQRRRH